MSTPLVPDPAEPRGRFDRAVVLFNHGAYFEAHEDWEVLWLEARGAERRWLQALIQLAAAFVHYERGFFARGFASLLRDASEGFAGYAGPAWGLDLERLAAQIRPWARHAAEVATGTPLGEGAPGAAPQLVYREGYEPAPWLVDEEGPA